MACGGDRKTMLSCIAAVCAAAQGVVSQIATVRDRLAALLTSISASQAALTCVLSGPVGTVCALPLGGTLPTLATKLDSINAAAVSAIVPEAAVATEGQTEWTLATTPDFLDIALNGGVLTLFVDFVFSGSVVTFLRGLQAGDELSAWKYML